MFDKNKDILPVGSIVLLKNGKLRLMIIGLFPLLDDGKYYYDYCACLYPAGVLSLKTIGFFNRESISSVYSIGLIDEDTNSFMRTIKEKEQELISNGNYIKKKDDDLDSIFGDIE